MVIRVLRDATVVASAVTAASAADALSVTVIEKLFVVSALASVVGHENNPDEG